MQKEPLKSLDDLKAFDGEKYTQEVAHKRCSHELKLVSSTEARCKKCPAGWSGPNISKLVALLKTTS